MKDLSFLKLKKLPYDWYLKLWKLSMVAIGRTSPNPAVATLLTNDKKILSFGATEPVGKRHSEVVAIEHFYKKYKTNLNIFNNQIYFIVTLEPCSTYGRTLPCTLKIKCFKEFIKKVIIENLDINLNKSGLLYLINEGFDVEVKPIFKKPHFALHSFESFIKKKSPSIL